MHIVFISSTAVAVELMRPYRGSLSKKKAEAWVAN